MVGDRTVKLAVSTSDDDERIELLRRHVAHLETQCGELERAWGRVPRLGAAALLALPAAYFWGIAAGVMVVVLSGALVVTSAYLTGMRRSWARSELRDTRKDLARLEAAARA